MKMKKKSFIWVAIIMLFTFSNIIAASSMGVQANKNNETIKIGAILSLSGVNADSGKEAKRALDMLVEKTNNNGGIKGTKILIVYKDDKCDNEVAQKVALELVNKDKVVAIIGPGPTSLSMKVGPLLSKQKVPMITPLSTNP